jgi:hypothetical protein
LFFADHTRNEIWAMLPGANGLPNPTQLQSFVGVDAAGGAAGHPVDLKIGPGGDLFYVDMDDGTIHRITYTPRISRRPPPSRRARPTDRYLSRSASTAPVLGPGGQATYVQLGP